MFLKKTLPVGQQLASKKCILTKNWRTWDSSQYIHIHTYKYNLRGQICYISILFLGNIDDSAFHFKIVVFFLIFNILWFFLFFLLQTVNFDIKKNILKLCR